MMLDTPFVETYTDSPSTVHEHLVTSQYSLPTNLSIQDTAEFHLANMTDEEMDNNWKLNDFFGTIAIINLIDATERLSRIEDELELINTENYIIFDAINGRKDLSPNIWKKLSGNRNKLDASTPQGRNDLDYLHKGEAGCYMSHYTLIRTIKVKYDEAQKLLKYAKEAGNDRMIAYAKREIKKYSSVLILEDNCGFGFVQPNKRDVTKQGTGRALRQSLAHLPKDWDMLYFVVHAKQKTAKINEHLQQVNSTWSATAYAINCKMYAPLLKRLSEINNPRIKKVLPLDEQISSIHHLFKVYAVNPALSYHHAGNSQIGQNGWNELWQEQPFKGKK